MHTFTTTRLMAVLFLNGLPISQTAQLLYLKEAISPFPGKIQILRTYGLTRVDAL